MLQKLNPNIIIAVILILVCGMIIYFRSCNRIEPSVAGYDTQKQDSILTAMVNDLLTRDSVRGAEYEALKTKTEQEQKESANRFLKLTSDLKRYKNEIFIKKYNRTDVDSVLQWLDSLSGTGGHF